MYIILALLDLLPREHEVSALLYRNDQIIVWLLCLTVFTWLGMLALIGAVAPACCTSKTFLILVIVPLSMIGWLFLLLGSPGFYALPLAWLAMLLIIGATVRQRIALANRPGRFLRYTFFRHIVVAVTSLGLTVAIAVIIVVVSGIVAGVWMWGPFTLLTSTMLTVLTAALMGKMKPTDGKIVNAVMGTWIMIIVVGWCWYLSIDDGLGAFMGEESATAETALNRVDCGRLGPWFIPAGDRVIKDPYGQFHALGYTWWGIPVACPRSHGN